MLISLIALSTAIKKIVSLFIVSMRMCIPWIQSFLLGTVLIQCLEHALYLVGTLKLNIELRNVWLCGGPAGYFCLYHCSILCMCVIEIPFHLTFSSCARPLPYLGNCSLLYWPRHDSHLGWVCWKFSFLYLFFILDLRM